MNDKTTHFGFQQVAIDDKAHRVRDVFDSVAGKYDVMNDLMSLGIHRLWKRIAISLSNVRYGEKILDLAGGTGDLTALFEQRVGKTGEIVLTDINASMLQAGRDRLIDQGIAGNIRYAQVNAEKIPFEDNYFDCVCISFGLRNVTDKDAALRSMYRVLKPGGRMLIVEFSKPHGTVLNKIYDFYSFNVLPKLGEIITHDADSYRYLAESIRMHPDQETLKNMLEAAGFGRCQFFNLTLGIVAIHRGYKL